MGGGGAWPDNEPTRRVSNQAPLVWRAPEGPEGTGGLRGAAPNEVRTPSLAGGRALRRPEHPWGHKQPGPRGGLAGGRALRRPEHPWDHKQPGPKLRQRAYETGAASAGGDHQKFAIPDTAARPQTATVETGGTSAATDAGQHETTITTVHPRTATTETGNTSATKKRTKSTHFSPAKAMAVSTGSPHRPAKETRVSIRRK